MSTAVDEDVQLLEHLDFDPTCEARQTRQSPECGKPAAWAAVCKKCGSTALICDECRERVLSLTNYAEHACGARGTIAETVAFYPIRSV